MRTFDLWPSFNHLRRYVISLLVVLAFRAKVCNLSLLITKRNDTLQMHSLKRNAHVFTHRDPNAESIYNTQSCVGAQEHGTGCTSGCEI